MRHKLVRRKLHNHNLVRHILCRILCHIRTMELHIPNRNKPELHMLVRHKRVRHSHYHNNH